GAALLVATLSSPALTPWVATASKALPPVASIARVPVAADMPLHLIVSLKLRDKDALAAFIRSPHTPGSPQYGVVLSTQQFRDTYAPTAQQAQAVQDYLVQAGFSHVALAPNRTLISADATAAAAQAAFNTTLVQYRVDGKTVFSNVGDIQVPA